MTAAIAAVRPPVVLHAVAGVALVVVSLRMPCGSDECLGPLYAGASAVVWALAVPVVFAAARSSLREVRVVAWVAPLLCVPLAWAAALTLFFLFPSLGGA